MKRPGTTIALVATLVVALASPAGAAGEGRRQVVSKPGVTTRQKSAGGGLRQRLTNFKSRFRLPRFLRGKIEPELPNEHAAVDGFVEHLPIGPAANAKGFLRGLARGPLHLVDHLKSPKVFVVAVTAAAGLGVGVEAANIDMEVAAWIVKVATLGVRGWYAVPRIVAAKGPERWRQVGLEVVGTVSIGLELFGIHVLHDHGGHEHEGGLDGSFASIVSAAGEGLLAFHDLFFMPFGHDHNAHEQAPEGQHEHEAPTKAQ